MTATRTKDEVIRSLGVHRAGLAEGVGDASKAARETVATAGRWRELEIWQKLVDWRENWRELLDWQGFAARHETELQRTAKVAGFVSAGGLRRRRRGSMVLGKRAVRVDKTSRQVGRAMAGLAATDSSLRRRRGLGRIFRSGRRLALVGAAAGGWAYLVTDEVDREKAIEGAGRRLEGLASGAWDRAEELQAKGGVAALLSR